MLRRLVIEAIVDEGFQIGNQKVKTTLVKFSSMSSAHAIFGRGVLQKLKGSNISLRPDLCPEIRQARLPWYPTLNKLKREGRKVYFKGVQLICDGKVVEKFSVDLEAGNSVVKARCKNSRSKGLEEDNVPDGSLSENGDTE